MSTHRFDVLSLMLDDLSVLEILRKCTESTVCLFLCCQTKDDGACVDVCIVDDVVVACAESHQSVSAVIQFNVVCGRIKISKQ